MKSLDIIRELEEIYELLDKYEQIQITNENRARRIQIEFKEEENEICKKYNQKGNDLENELKRLQGRKKFLLTNILLKPINLTLATLGISMTFAFQNLILRIALPILAGIYLLIKIFNGVKNIPIYKKELINLEQKTQTDINELAEKHCQELKELGEQFKQKELQHSLNMEEKAGIKEKLERKDLVPDFYKNKNNIRTFIKLLSNGRSTSIEGCIKITEFDDREIKVLEMEHHLKEKAELLSSLEETLSTKEKRLIGTEKILEERKKTLDFNKNILDQLVLNISKIDTLSFKLNDTMSSFESLNGVLKEIDEVLFKKIMAIEYRLKEMEQTLFPRRFEQIETQILGLDENVKRHLSDMDRLAEKRFENLDYTMEQRFRELR